MRAYDVVTDALRTAGMKVTESSAGARSQCPAHGSRGLSLAIRPNPKNPDGPLHVTCFAGCEAADVLEAISLQLKDLYDDNGSRTVHARGQSRPRPKPNPFADLIPDPEHFCDRIIQQEALDAGPPFPGPVTVHRREQLDVYAELDAAWARHARAEMAEYGTGGGDGYGEWSPERKADFAEFRAEVDARHGVTQ